MNKQLVTKQYLNTETNLLLTVQMCNGKLQRVIGRTVESEQIELDYICIEDQFYQTTMNEDEHPGLLELQSIDEIEFLEEHYLRNMEQDVNEYMCCAREYYDEEVF